MSTDLNELPPWATHKPRPPEDDMSEYAEYVVTAVQTIAYACKVSADSPGEAATMVGDRIRDGRLDGIAVKELGLTDMSVSRADTKTP